MRINAREGTMQRAELFGKPVLFSASPVDRDTVPRGWHCYDLCGGYRAPEVPRTLEDEAVVNYTGTVLSPVPLKKPETRERQLRGQLVLHEERMTLEQFCRENRLEYPADTRKYIPRPASPEEAGLFYALPREKDAELGAVGHVRLDFGDSGKGFYTTWWPRGPEELNTAEFRTELDEVVNELREGVLKDRGSMRRYCYGHGGEIEGGWRQNYGYIVETEHYRYCLRCAPGKGDYDGYLTAFDKRAQEMQQAQKDEKAMTMGGMSL